MSTLASVLGSPLRPGLGERASGFAGGLAVLIGLVLLADALITFVWGDPLTAVFAQRDQKALGKELAAAERAPLPASTLALVKRVGSERERMALVSRHLQGRAEAGDPLGRIAIPRTGTNLVFVSGTGAKSLKGGPGHYAGTVLPGQPGTVAVAGHRTTYSAPFRHLDRMRNGDRITLTMPYGRFSYRVEGSRVVSPTYTRVLRHVRHDRLVLTTCTPLFTAKKRIVVTARLERSTARGAAIELRPLPPVAPL